MTDDKPDKSKFDQFHTAQRDYVAKRERGYREKALKLFPWLCGRCAREFNRSNLRELTVHHINHDHGDNPPDGSNWELLCVYCHDEEHTKFENLVRFGSTEETKADAATFKPFANLKNALEKKA